MARSSLASGPRAIDDSGRLISGAAQRSFGDTGGEHGLGRPETGRGRAGSSHLFGRQRPLSSVGEEPAQRSVRLGFHPDSLLV